MNMWIPSLSLIAAMTLQDPAQEPQRPRIITAHCHMTVEWSPGDEAVLQIVAETEHRMRRVRLTTPDGRALVDLDGGAEGMTRFALEYREDDLETLLAKYREGVYRFRAATMRGDYVLGSGLLSFDLPSVPRIESPQQGQKVGSSGLVVSWVPDPGVVAYLVQIEQGPDSEDDEGEPDNDIDDGIRVRLPPAQKSFVVPDGLLAPDMPTSVEIVAIGPTGNRTKKEVVFYTSS